MSMPTLRPYQAAGIEAGRDVLRQGKRRFVLFSATGSGKTIMGMAFISGALAKGKRVAFIANRITLVSQASHQLSKAGIHHGVIQGDNSFNTSANCIVCSIQTVARRGLPPVDVIVIDEAHGVAGSKDYRNLIFRNNNLPVIGLSATPWSRGMAKPYPELLGEPLFESMVTVATIRDLIRDGFLCDCEIYAPSEPDLTGVKTKRNQFGEMDYDEKQLADAVDKPALVGDIVSHWKRMANGKVTVCFATNIAHSRHIVEQFKAAGVAAEHLDGYMQEEERAGIMGRMARGEITVLSNVAVLREGWDMPECEVMILARPTKSLIAWVQMVGRILRPHPGKEIGIVLDHSGSAHELGYPTDDLPTELCDGSAKSSEKKQTAKEDPKPKKCPSCSYMKPPKVHTCPKCGFAPQKTADVEHIDGELKLIDRTKKGALSKASKQEIYSQLLSIRHERGYSDGWVARTYRDIFSVWPRGLNDICTEPTQEVRNFVRSKLIRHAKGKEKEMRNAA